MRMVTLFGYFASHKADFARILPTNLTLECQWTIDFDGESEMFEKLHKTTFIEFDLVSAK